MVKGVPSHSGEKQSWHMIHGSTVDFVEFKYNILYKQVQQEQVMVLYKQVNHHNCDHSKQPSVLHTQWFIIHHHSINKSYSSAVVWMLKQMSLKLSKWEIWGFVCYQVVTRLKLLEEPSPRQSLMPNAQYCMQGHTVGGKWAGFSEYYSLEVFGCETHNCKSTGK